MKSAISIAFLCLVLPGFGQGEIRSFFGIGATVNTSVYERYVNPHTLGDAGSHSTGSFLLNIPGPGVKVWLGGKELKLSVEGRVHYAPAAINFDFWNEYTGLGAISFPILAKLNMYGPEYDYFTVGNSFWTEKHWSVGGGVQYTRTDLYAQPSLSKAGWDEPLVRDWFTTYVLAFEFGVVVGNGMWVDAYLEYGINEFSGSTFRLGVGIGIDFLVMFNSAIIGPEFGN